MMDEEPDPAADASDGLCHFQVNAATGKAANQSLKKREMILKQQAAKCKHQNQSQNRNQIQP